MPDETAGGIKVVLTSPRVAPGLLTRATWQALAAADEIGAAGGPNRPDVQAVIGSGLLVTQVEDGVEAAWAWLSSAAAAGRQGVWVTGGDGGPGVLRVGCDGLGGGARAPP